MSLAMRGAKIQRRAMMGDPGLGSFLGKALKGVVGGITGFATGGLSGAVRGVASPFIKQPTIQPMQMPVAQPPGFGGGVQIGGTVTIPGVGTVSGGTGGGITIAPPGSGFGPGFGPVVGGGSSTAPLAPGACVPGMRGVRTNKTGYFLRSGQYVPPGTKCVKSRRRNPLNPRALSKAMGRVVSFKKAATAASRISIRSAKSCGCK